MQVKLSDKVRANPSCSVCSQGALMLLIALRFDFAKESEKAQARFQDRDEDLVEPLLEQGGEQLQASGLAVGDGLS